MKKNLLILGGTSGLMLNMIETFQKSFNITFTYSHKKNLQLTNFSKLQKIKFFKINLLDNEDKIISILKKK